MNFRSSQSALRRTRKFLFRSIAKVLTIALSSSILAIVVAAPAKAAPACASGATATVSGVTYTVSPSHGQVFYIDTGVTPRLDAAYVGYNIQTSANKSNIWVKLSSFTGGQVTLANGDSNALQQISTITSGAANAKTAYFLLKASGTTSASAQTHNVTVYDGNPNRGGTELYSCDFTFTNVRETIKAAANKVQTISVPAANPNLGSLVTIVVTGTTGNPGAGASPDGDVMWVSPAAYSTWPTSALRLESTSIIMDQDGDFSSTSDQVTTTDKLLITGMNGNYFSSLPGGGTKKVTSATQYRATYNFRVIGSASSAVRVAPVAQISSGTQMKHSDLSSLQNGSAFPTINLSGVTSTMSVTKKISPIARVTNKALTSNVATLTTQEAHGLADNDKVYVSDVGAPFDGLQTITSVTATTFTFAVTNANITSTAATGEAFKQDGTSAVVPYEVTVSSTDATNTLSVDEIVDSPSSTATPYSPNYVAGSSQIKDTTRTSFTTIANPILDLTEASVSPRPYHFTGPFTATSATPVKLRYRMLLPVTASTTYSNTLYAKAGNQIVGSDASANPKVSISTSSSGVSGTTETTENLPPTVTTLSVSAINTTTATLTGSTDPNGNATSTSFQYGTASDLSGATTVIATPSSTNSANPVNLSANLTNLTSNTTYYYRARISYIPSGGSLTTINGNILSFTTSLSGTTAQTITWGTTFATVDLRSKTSETQTNNLSSAGGTSYSAGNAYASSGLPITVTSSTTNICTVATTTTYDTAAIPQEIGQLFTISYLATGTCTLVASQSGSATYAAAPNVTKTFTVDRTYVVTFNGNGQKTGSPSVPSVTQSSFGASVTLATSGNLSKDGATFGGWNTLANGTGNTYAAGSTYTPTSDITLYAVWGTGSYTITYNGNTNTGGNAPTGATQNYNTTYTVLGNVAATPLSKTNYTFSGWNTAANGSGASYAAGETFPVVANITLYAQWNGNPLTVTYNTQLGSSVSNGSTVVGGQIADSPGTPTRDGYAFAGWFTASSGGAAITFPYIHNQSADFTLFAQWTSNTLVVSYDSQGGTIYPTDQTTSGGQVASSPGTPT